MDIPRLTILRRYFREEGLAIPGRHIASDGTIRDADGLHCFGKDDYPRGTVVETSLALEKYMIPEVDPEI